jgi:hypothetical protein
MAVQVFPAQRLGWWGLGVTLGFVMLFLLRVGAAFPLPSPLIFGAGVIGVVLSVWAVVRGERSLVLMIVAVVVAAFVLFWVGGELLFPH